MNVLATGKIPDASNITGTWLELKLDVKGTTITGSIADAVVGTAINSVFSHGMVAIGSGWHEAAFDDLSLSATEGAEPAVPTAL